MPSVVLKKFMLSPQHTIRDALECMTQNQKGITLVVDSKNQLLGTVTDGDTRRALLAGKDLDTPLNLVMKTNPIFITEDMDEKAIRSVLSVSGLRQIPVLNSSRQVTNIKFPFEPQNQPIKIKAIIMAGGLGTRLRPITNHIPKPLIKMGDKAIIENIIDNLTSQGIRDISISINYKKDQIIDFLGNGERWNANIEYIEETKPLGTLGAVSHLQVHKDEVILIVNGDIYTNLDYLAMGRFHVRHKSEFTVAIRSVNYEFPYGMVNLKDYVVTSVSEKPEFRFNINAGIYMMNSNLLKKIPKNQFVQATDFIKQQLLENSFHVHAFLITESWIDIGQHENLEKAKDMYKKDNST